MSAANAEELEALRIKYLSKKGEITALFNEFRLVPADQKRELGQLLNQLRQAVFGSGGSTAQSRSFYGLGIEINKVFEAKDYADAVVAQGGEIVRQPMEALGFAGTPAGYMIIFCICAVAYLIGWTVMKSLVPKYSPVVVK